MSDFISRFGGFSATFVASVSSRMPILVTRHGDAWRHRWLSNSLYNESPMAFPHHEGILNWSIFTNSFAPRVGDVVVDAGAGIGTELRRFSKSVGYSGRVIAIDASGVCCDYMNLQIRDLGLSNVEVINFAIGSHDGTIQFENNGTSLRNKISKTGEGSSVNVKPLDSILDERSITHVDFLKLNIEGAEFEVLNSINPSRYRRIVVSCHDFMGEPDLRTYENVLHWGLENGYSACSMASADAGSCEANYLFFVSNSAK
jgi:FkbM family methyltransferase